MRAVALLANPDSGSGEAEDVAAWLRDRGLEVREYGFDDVEEALRARPETVIVAGGDGSLGSVAGAAARAGIPLAVIPTGTANDFARELGIPRDAADACELAAQAKQSRDLDVGRMDERPFLNAASLGLPPAAAEHATGLKRVLGPLAYAVGAVVAGLRAKPVECTVRCDGEEIYSGVVWQVTVACTGAFGAGSSIETELADSRLDVVVIEAGSRARLALHAYGLRAGGLGDQTGVKKVRCAEASVEFDGSEQWNVDGELVESRSCRFRVDPEPVRVIVP